ncbi:DUF6492 family protein [Sphingomonas sp. VDB2]|uniref:DUF6492 family protein n=1 Tax=Sphingomonas sp. VDB2 TaxID=3228751 RepID=UPI003A7FB3E7
MRSKISIVTVFYGGDAALMRLQARSLAKNFDHDSIEQIVLIFNDSRKILSEEMKMGLLKLYDSLAGKVEFFFPSDLGLSDVSLPGWKKQQVIKILSHRKCKSNKVLMLDAKNHFLIPTNASQYFTEEGTPRNFFSKKYGQQLIWAAASLKYFGNDPSLSQEEIPPTVTPYAVYRQTLHDLTREIEKRDSSVEALFAKPDFSGTEFYLIFSFLLWSASDGIREIFAEGEVPATIYSTWPATPEDVDKVLVRAESNKTHAFGLHSRRNRLLTKVEWDRIVSIWKAADIYDVECADYLFNNIVDL